MEQIHIIQVVALIFVLFAFSRVYLRYREKKLNSFTFLFWTGVWFAGVVSIFLPDVTTRVARFLGIGRGVDVVIYASIVIIFYLLFRIYILIEDTQREITNLARKVALKDVKTTKPKSR